MAATKRNFILSSGIGLSADNIYTISSTNSTSIGSGAFIVAGGVGIGSSVSIGGRLQMFNSSNYTAFVSSATGNTVYTLPATSPATGTSVLQSTSAGVLSWVPMTATAGASSGNTAQNIVVNSAGNASAFHPILFTPSSLSAGSAVSSDGTISFNPSTEILNVSGLAITATTASTSTANGALQVSGGVGIGGSIFGASTISAADNIEIKSGKELRLNNSGNTFYTGIKAGSNTSNTTYTFPTAFPGTGTSVLQSDTSGTLAWVAMAASSSGSGFTTLNALTSGIQYFSVGSSGNVFNISSTGSTHTFNIPIAGSGSTGLITTLAQTIAGAKTFSSALNISDSTNSSSSSTGALIVTGGVGIGQSVSVGGRLQMFNSANYTAFVSSASGNTVYTLPDTSPATGSSVLQSTSAGVMSWVPMTASSSGAGSGTVAIPGAQYQIAGYYSGTGASVSGSTTFTNHTANGVVNISHTTNSNNPSSGALTVTGGVGIGQSISVLGRLQLFNSSIYTAFVSSATGNTVYTLPATSPATGSSVLQSTSGGLLSWVPMASGSSTPGGSLDGSVQYKSGSGFGGTRSFFFNTTTNGLRLGDFPGEELPTSNSAALLIEQTISSFNGSVNGTLIGVNSLSSFTGDLINLQTNAVTRFKVGSDGGMGVSSLSSSGNVVITSSTNSTSTTTGALVVTGGVGIGGTLNVGADLGISGLTTLTYTSEKLNTKTSATGTVTHDLSTGSVFYHSSISNNFTANFTNVPTTNDRALGVTLILAQGGTPYMSTALQIDGSAQTIKWVNNITPTGTANKVDIVGFSLIRTGSAWTVLGQYSTYG